MWSLSARNSAYNRLDTDGSLGNRARLALNRDNLKTIVFQNFRQGKSFIGQKAGAFAIGAITSR
jgi:hypothetical protein